MNTPGTALAIPMLATPRLVLRAPHVGDLPAYLAAWADERTTRFVGGEPRSAEVSYAKFLQMTGLWALYGFGYWVWADRHTDAYAGCGGLADFRRGIAELDGYPEAGWALAPDAWGKGLASEAVAAITHWADAALGKRELRCIIAPGNDASVRVAEKSGFLMSGEVASALGVSILFRRPGASAPASG